MAWSPALTATLLILIVPGCLFCANVIVRTKFSLPISTGADWVLLLMAADAVILLQPASIQDAVKQVLPADKVSMVFGVMFFIALVVWLLTVLYAEPTVENVRRKKMLQRMTTSSQPGQGGLNVPADPSTAINLKEHVGVVCILLLMLVTAGIYSSVHIYLFMVPGG
ncbi:hypothetical protein [Achromobacter denitrificans]|uniref:hypothetical protein n=1 Tax=Achromobacter denitrificans TaxID=32002 RepID=UPI003CFE2A48